MKRKLADEYCLEKTPLGSGTYGVVFKGTKDGSPVAVKRMKIEPDMDCTTWKVEIEHLRRLAHSPNVVKLIHVAHESIQTYVVYEWMECDLHAFIFKRKNWAITPQTVRTVMRQLLTGVQHCHELRIMHRDIKPGNVLINPDTLTVKLCDFGLARKIARTRSEYPLTRSICTMCYRAPELLLSDGEYGTAIDLWALGCTMYELCTRKELWRDDTEVDMLMKIFRFLGTPDEKTWPGLLKTMPYFNVDFPRFRPKNPLIESTFLSAHGADLLARLFTYSPYHRISASKALDHEYFTNFDGDPTNSGESI